MLFALQLLFGFLYTLPHTCETHLLLSIFSSASFSWEAEVGHQEGIQLNIQELGFERAHMQPRRHDGNKVHANTDHKMNFVHMTSLLSVLWRYRIHTVHTVLYIHKHTHITRRNRHVC